MTEFQLRLRRRNIPELEIIEDMQRVSEEVGSGSLTKVQYDERGMFGATTILRKFGTWNKALENAGLLVMNRQDIRNEELFQNLAEVWTKLGRQPFGREMSDKSAGSIFSLGTYEKRFGSWNNSLLAFVEYINTGSDQGGELVRTGTADMGLAKRQRRTPRDVNWRLRAKILIRDCCICKMYGDSPAKNSDTVLHVDHILGWANGGETLEENLQTLCAPCNIGKSDVIF
jgi:hypothetical protein